MSNAGYRIHFRPSMKTSIYRLQVLGYAAAFALTAIAVGPANARAAGPAEPIQIPVLSSQTGPGASYGENNVTAMEMAAAEVNAHGGVLGHPIALEVQDTQSSPSQAAILVRQDAAKYLAALGPNLSNDAKAAFPVAVQLKFPMVSSGISDARIMVANRPWTFSTFIPAQVLAASATETWVKRTGAKTIVAIVNNQDDASAIQESLMQAAVAKDGVKVLKVITVASRQPDYSAEVSLVKSLAPQGIIVGDLPPDAGAIVKALTTAGVDVPVMISMNAFTPDFLTVAGKSARNVSTFTEFWSGLQEPAAKKFTAAYLRKSHGVPPGLSAVTSYDSVLLLADAMRRAHVTGLGGSTTQEREALIHALAATKGFHGLLQSYDIGSEGYRTGAGFYLRITNGVVSLAK